MRLRVPLKHHHFFWFIMVCFLCFMSACGNPVVENLSPTSGDAAVSEQSKPIESEAPSSSAYDGSTASSAGNNSENSKQIAQAPSQQYLAKTMTINMEVKDPRTVAIELSNWISQTDPQATSIGTTYRQRSGNDYEVTQIFSVQATLYSKIYAYLRDYTSTKDGKLLSLNESVEDVSNTYIDVESRIGTLRTEQKRLQELMSEAEDMTDLLLIEERLSIVQSNLESYQAQKNALDSRIQYYTITINLTPPSQSTTVPEPDDWSIGLVFQNAINAFIIIGQIIITALIWLLMLSIYIIPIIVLIFLGRLGYQRWRQRQQSATVTPNS